jgi:FtsP/CotA-like multicopper oxidase with cupredoxin domain
VSRTAQITGAAILGALVLTAGCGAPPPNPPAGAPTTTDPTADSRAATTAQVIAVTFADGRSDQAGDRIAVALGEAVQLTVTSNVADEMHLHGYDLSALVTAGGSATLTFTADIPGVFEIELEESGEPLARLEVS